MNRRHLTSYSPGHGPTLLELHRALLDRAVRIYLDTQSTERRQARLEVRIHARHVAIAENPYTANDRDTLARVEAMAMERVKRGITRRCPRCGSGLQLASGLNSCGHDPERE